MVSSRSIKPQTSGNIALAKAVLSGDAEAVRQIEVVQEPHSFAAHPQVIVEGGPAKKSNPNHGSLGNYHPIQTVIGFERAADPNAAFGYPQPSLLAVAVGAKMWDVAQALLDVGANPFAGSKRPDGGYETTCFHGSAISMWNGSKDDPETQAWFQRMLAHPRYLKEALADSSTGYRASLFLFLQQEGSVEALQGASAIKKSLPVTERSAFLLSVLKFGKSSEVVSLSPWFKALSKEGFASLQAQSLVVHYEETLSNVWQAIQCRPVSEWADHLAPEPLPPKPESKRSSVPAFLQFDGLLTSHWGVEKSRVRQWEKVFDEALAVPEVAEVLKNRWDVLLGAGLQNAGGQKAIKRLLRDVPKTVDWATLTVPDAQNQPLPVLEAALPNDQGHISIEVLRLLQKKGAPLTKEVLVRLAKKVTYSSKVDSIGPLFLEWSRTVPATDEMFEQIRLPKDADLLRRLWREQQLETSLPAVASQMQPSRTRF